MNTASPGITITESSFDHYSRQRSTTVCGMQGITLRGPVNVPTLCTSWEQFVRVFGGFTSDGYGAYAAKAFFDNGGEQLYVSRVAHYTDILDADTLAAAASTITIKDRSGVRASGTTGSVGSNRIAWRALQTGTGGNSVSVTLVVSGVSTPLSVSVAGSDVTVNLETSDTSTAVSTVTEVLAAIEDSVAASALLTAASVETGVCAAVSKVTLSGGTAAADSITIEASSPGEWGDALSATVQDCSNGSTTLFDLIVLLDGAAVETYRYVSMSSLVAALAQSNYVRATVVATAPFATNDRPAAGTYALTAGNDGLTSIGDVDYIGDSSTHTGLYSFDALPGIRVLCSPGVSSGAVNSAIIAYAAARKDLFPVTDTPVGLTESEVLDYRRGTGSYTHAAFDNSYGALYWPWGRITDPLTRTEKLVPPAGAVAGCYVRSDKLAGPGAAPAGVERGKIYGWLGVERSINRATYDLLYPEGINVIAEFPDSGVTIDGQRTLEQAATSTDRVNARRELIYVETAIEASSRFVKFEPNIQSTWSRLRRAIEPILQTEKDRDALTDFYFQCDEATNPPEARDRHELNARVFVKITPTGEFIGIQIVKTDSSTSFTEIFNA